MDLPLINNKQQPELKSPPMKQEDQTTLPNLDRIGNNTRSLQKDRAKAQVDQVLESKKKKEKNKRTNFFKLVSNPHVEEEHLEEFVRSRYKTTLYKKPWMQHLMIEQAKEDIERDPLSRRATSSVTTGGQQSMAAVTAASTHVPVKKKTSKILNPNSLEYIQMKEQERKLKEEQARIAEEMRVRRPSQMEAYVAQQNLNLQDDHQVHMKEIDEVRNKIKLDYNDATSVHTLRSLKFSQSIDTAESKKRRPTLYQTILNNTENQAYRQQMQIEGVILKDMQTRNDRQWYQTVNRIQNTKKSPWSKGFGIISSEQHLLKAMNQTKRTEAYRQSVPQTDAEISQLYMPKIKRVMGGNESKESEGRDSQKQIETDRPENLKHKFKIDLTKFEEENIFEANVDLTSARYQGGLKQTSRLEPFDNIDTERLRKKMERKVTKMITRENMKIVKKEKPKKRKMSLTTCQMKYELPGTFFHQNFPSKILSDKQTILKMKQAGRFPMPEKLLHVPENFELQIDSLINAAYNTEQQELWANYKPDVDAPCNSQESQEDIEFYSSSDESEKNENRAKHNIQPDDLVYVKKRIRQNKFQNLDFNQFEPDTKEAKEHYEKHKDIKIHKQAINMHGFNLDLLKQYPFKKSSGQIPSILSKTGKLGDFEDELYEIIIEEFKDRTFLPTREHLQVLYEHFCKQWFLCAPVTLLRSFEDGILNFSDYELSLDQVKAISCIIPLIPGLKQVRFENNHLKDHACCIIFIACFMHPYAEGIQIVRNELGLSSANTFQFLMQKYPNKMKYIDFDSSIDIGNFSKIATKNMDQSGLKELNLSQVPLSSTSCVNVSSLLIFSKSLKELNLNGCQIAGQGTRSIMDGLNVNRGLQNFDFSFNSMRSTVYEFSIKLAKVISRHEEMMHLNISSVQISKEETIFIGMSLSHSKALISLHLSLNGLTYYDRVFLRTLINGKIKTNFKNFAQEVKMGIRNVAEKQAVRELASEDFVDEELKQFLKSFEFVQKQSLLLDDQISEILLNVDITQMFREIRVGELKKKNSPVKGVKMNDAQKNLDIVPQHTSTQMEHQRSKLFIQELIEKINSQTKCIIQQKQETERFHDQQINLNDPLQVENFKRIGLYNRDQYGEDLEQKSQSNDDAQQDESWLLHNMLKIERIRQRVQVEAERLRKNKSSGEMALMFMGISKIANDLLMEYPNTGYMKEVIFTRVLGNVAIEDGEIWKDTMSCWVCEKWCQHRIDFCEEDIFVLQQNISKIDELDDVLKKCLFEENSNYLVKVPNEEVKQFFLGLKNLKQKPSKSNTRQISEVKSDETKTDEQIFTEYNDSDDEQRAQQLKFMMESDIMNPVKFTRVEAEKLLPSNLRIVKPFKNTALRDHSSSSSDETKSMEIMAVTKSSFRGKTQNNFNKFNPMSSDGFKGYDKDSSTGKSSHLEKRHNFDISAMNQTQPIFEEGRPRKKQRKFVGMQLVPKEPKYKTVNRKIFFGGATYMIEDKIRIDSDKESSINTSSDEFETDDEGVKQEFHQTQTDKLKRRTQAEMEKSLRLQKSLKQNEPLKINQFGRNQIFVCASFNDWVPQEMKTVFEINTEKATGNDYEKIKEFLKQQRESTKDEENVIQYTNIVPPGKHYFYFIYDRKFIFLSPMYEINRFKGTNVFLNCMTMKKRKVELQKFVVKSLSNEAKLEMKTFKYEKSVFRTYQEDDADLIQKMFNTDLAYSKINRLSKIPEEQAALHDLLHKNYLKIKNIFIYIAANSTTYPNINLNDFTAFCYKSRIFDRNLNLASIDRIFLAATSSLEKGKKSDEEKQLRRHDFLEIICRLARAKFIDVVPKQATSLSEACEKLFEKVLVNNPSLDGAAFRKRYVFTIEVDQILRRNQEVIKELYTTYSNKDKQKGNKDTFLTFNQVREMVKNSNLNISSSKVNFCYVESLMSRYDTLKDPKVSSQMRYVEFIVFIAKMAFEIYKGTKQKNIELQYKIDSILNPLLATILKEKRFSLAEPDGDQKEKRDDSFLTKANNGDDESKNTQSPERGRESP